MSLTKSSSDNVGTALVQQPPLAALVHIIFLVIFWYIINISLIISNKWLISEVGFHSTSMLTLLHMMSSCICSSLLLGLGLVPNKPASWALMCKVGVLAACFTVSVATCMASLAYLPASFVQAIGSTTPAFTAVLAYLIQGRLEADLTYAALLPVVVGIALASGGEPLLNMLGLVLQLVACSTRSFKTVMQAVLLTDERERFHPMTLLAYTSAMSSFLLALLTAITEPHSIRHMLALHASQASFAPLMAISCTLAFVANFTNFLISKKLGALTLQVLGNFKNVLAAGTALAVFNNPVTVMGLTGYGITTIGVFLYSNMVHKNPARWVTPPVSRLLGSAFTYKPIPDAALSGRVLHLAVGAGVAPPQPSSGDERGERNGREGERQELLRLVDTRSYGGSSGWNRSRGPTRGSSEGEDSDGPQGDAHGERAALLVSADKV